MRSQLIAHVLVATAAATILPRATDSADMECLQDILDLAQKFPKLPADAFKITATPTCLSPSLNSAVSSFNAEATSWISEIAAEISKCPAFPSDAFTMPAMTSIPSLPNCTGATATAAATGMTTATATGRSQTTGTTQATGTSSTASGSAASGTTGTPSTSTNAASRETGAAFVAAVAVIAAAAAL